MANRQLPVVQPGKTIAPPEFEKVAIVGLGLIGGSIALGLRATWPTGLVIGVDEKDVLEKAMVLHAIDVAADDPVVLAEADLVILAAPVRENLRLIADLPQHVRGEAVVTDVGSTKRAIVQAARALPPRLTFVGGHPLGGAARRGIEYARPDLFERRPWLFTPTPETARAAIDRLFRFAAALGAEPRSVPADVHDRLLAAVSHLPQLAVSALMHVVGELAGDEGLALSGRGLADATRLASSPASTWRDICATNADHLGPALDRLIAVLTELRVELKAHQGAEPRLDSVALDRVFESANQWRERLPTGGS
jgi:prephenate dehydrogenase